MGFIDKTGKLLLCPQPWRSWRGILVLGCASVYPWVRPSVDSLRTVHARVLKFHTWIPYGKIADTCFLSCPCYLRFWSYAPWKIRIKYDACHILWTVHARVLTFHIWIHHGQIADPYFFLVRVISLSGVMPLWNNQNEILSARYLEKYLSYRLETWSADRGWWIDYLIKI